MDLFGMLISDEENLPNYGQIVEDVKVENPTPYLHPDPVILIPEVKT